MLKHLFSVTCILGLCLFSACHPRMHHPKIGDTLGQELIDLKKAYDGGAISEAEYANAKEGLISGYKPGKRYGKGHGCPYKKAHGKKCAGKEGCPHKKSCPKHAE